jgi:hypothetical protein
MRPHLPDPSSRAPCRPFESDPGWEQAWWWLGVPLIFGLLVILSYQINEKFYREWVVHEGYGFVEFSQFITASAAFAVAFRLLWEPIVRRRRAILAVVVLAALSCLFIAGEEISWGQTFLRWQTPTSWASKNLQGETNLHNLHDIWGFIFNSWSRNVLGFSILIGGLVVPFAAAFDPKLRAVRISLFLPAAALVPTALGTLFFQVDRWLEKLGFFYPFHIFWPSEIVESYMYFFVLRYLIVLTRRISELKNDLLSEGGPERGPRPFALINPSAAGVKVVVATLRESGA